MSNDYNYTFNSLGSVGAIVLLNYMTIPVIEKSSIIFLHFSSLLGILFINRQYFSNFKESMSNVKPDITFKLKDVATSKP